MFGWLSKLLGGAPEEEKPEKSASKSDSTPSSPSEPEPEPGKGPLRPLDAPMIQARFQALGVTRHLEQASRHELRNTVMSTCRGGQTVPWWWPLRGFAKTARLPPQQLPFASVSRRAATVAELNRSLKLISTISTVHKLRFEPACGPDKNTRHPADKLKDDTLHLPANIGGSTYGLVLSVSEGVLDVSGLADQLNALFRSNSWNERLLLLPEHSGQAGLLLCTSAEAEQAQGSGWV
jgi:hypothetical protein